MPNNVRLTYFNLRARGEPCRLLLAYGGVKYEDTRIPYPPDVQWTRMKPKTDFGQLPILNWGGVEICQSMACARFIAREVGLAGKTSMEQAQVDEIVDIIQDLYNAWLKFFLAKDQAGLKNFNDVTLPTNLGMLEKKLVSRGGQFLVGNALSWADLHVFWYLGDLDNSAISKFPKLVNLCARVGSLPNIKAWVDSRPKTAV